jgi:GR25 family glycosyltransferase involved in LPS biosynthesis
MNTFDFFSEIWCVNLDKRTDRWEQVQKEFHSIGILNKVQRFSAIKHQDGRIGVIKSNLELLKYAKSKKLENILIFEDDVKFINYDEAKLNLAINDLPKNWSLLYLGANTHIPLVKKGDHLYQLKNGYATHSLCYNKIMYNQAITQYTNTNKITEHGQILDVWLAKIQEKYPCYLVNPIMTTQETGFSDIENKFVDYSFIEERAKNNCK